jgi:uncharacterized membrane protein (DUF485 family)
VKNLSDEFLSTLVSGAIVVGIMIAIVAIVMSLTGWWVK